MICMNPGLIGTNWYYLCTLKHSRPKFTLTAIRYALKI